MARKWTGRGARILDFDCESRPLSFLGSDYTTDEVTAIAAGWIGSKEVKVWTLGVRCQHGSCRQYHHGCSPEEMYADFHVLYDEADMVTGHFIRSFDLPLLNAMMLENGFPALSDKLSQDTKLDLKKRKSISASQENLGKMLGLRAPKIQMDTPRWREANRLTPEGIALTAKRVRGDVVQHKELRERLLGLGWLNPPKMWRSSGSIDPYEP